MVPSALAATYATPTGLPRWFITPRPLTIDEGGECSVDIYCVNPYPGARLRLWWYGIVGAANWKVSWHTALRDAALLVGCTYEADSGSNVIGSLSGSIIIGPDYAGGTLSAKNVARKNRKNNGTLNPDGSPPSRAVSMAVDAPSTNGSFRFVPSFQILVRDTSRTPVGQPSVSIRTFAADGISVPKTLYEEGESFQVALLTENIVPGTQVKIMIANVGQTRFSPSFRNAAVAAIRAAGCDYSVSAFPTPPGEVFYQGATAIFTDGYSDATSIRIPMNVKVDDIDQGRQQADFIIQVMKEGDLSEFSYNEDKGTWSESATYVVGNTVIWLDDGKDYVYTAAASSRGNLPSNDAYWRPWQKTIVYAASASRAVRDVPPRYWEIRATTDRTTIRYAMHVPSGSDGTASIVLASGGVVPPGFDAALAAAIAAHPETVTTDGGRIYARAAAQSVAELVWTVPHPAVAGKHTLRLTDIQGPGWIVIEDAVVYLSAPVLPVSPSFITGVNICGGEFGRSGAGGGDTYNVNYRYPHYPQRTDPALQYQAMDYYWRKGARLFRFPFLWPRIQKLMFGELNGDAPPVNGGDRADMWRIDDCVRYWTQVLGGYCLLDLHSFGKGPEGGNVRYDPDAVTLGTPIGALSDVWIKLANRYKDNDKVWLGIMNEPNGEAHNALRNRDNMQAVVNAIRARTDSTAKIFVAGCDYSSATNWVANGNAAALESFYDPAGNSIFEAHSYFDADGSGTKPACVSGSRNRLIAATNWAKANGVKLFLGEFGVGDPAVSGQQICGVEEPAALAYMAANKDAWFGWTSYFGGDMWGAAFPFTINPANFTTADDNGQMKLLLPYFETIPAMPAS